MIQVLNVFNAELFKVTRPRTLLIAVLVVILAASIATSVTVLGAESERPGGESVTVTDLEAAGGGTEAFSRGIAFSGIFVFVALAANWAGEFSQGTVRSLLMKQSSRTALLAGKFAGLAAFSAGLLLLFEALTFAISVALASTESISTAEWFSINGLGEAARDYATGLFWLTAWLSFGMMLGVILRSVPLTLGVGIAWAGPFENLTQEGWDVLAELYPGLLLRALAVGGTTEVEFSRAVVLLTAYALLALVLSFLSFNHRDVTA